MNETRALVSSLLKSHNADEAVTYQLSERVIRNLQTISVDGWQTDEIKALKHALKKKLAELEQI